MSTLTNGGKGFSLSIRAKLLLASGCLVLLTVIVGSWGVWVFSRSSATFQVAVQQTLPAVDHLLQMDRAMNEAVAAERSLLFLKPGSDAAQNQVQFHSDALGELVDRWARYSAIPAQPDERSLWPQFEKAYHDWEAVSREVVKTIGEDTPQARGDAIDISLNDGMEKLATARNILSQLIEIREDEARQRASAEQARAAQTRDGIVALVVIALVLAVVTTVMLARSINRPLGQTVRLLRDIADGEGDLTKRLVVASNDEIGELASCFNRFADKLAGIIGSVRLAATQVAGASQELSSASTQLASSTHEQASSLEETAASLEEMTATIKQSADNANQAARLAGGSRDSAENGGQVVAATIASMYEISQASKQISDIIAVIDDIAFQTNILALNAAVEAARAGEQGRGFAVVAAEVRALAQRCAVAAKDIRTLIHSSAAKVEEGTGHVTASKNTLSDIVQSVMRVADIVNEIAAASREQSSGIDQLNHAVNQMDRVTQNNAAQTEELSSTAESLAEQAEELQQLVGRFTLPGQADLGSTEPVAEGDTSPVEAEKQDVEREWYGQARGAA